MSDLPRLNLLFRHPWRSLLPSSPHDKETLVPSHRRFSLAVLVTGLLLTGLTGCTILEQQIDREGAEGRAEPIESESNPVSGEVPLSASPSASLPTNEVSSTPESAVESPPEAPPKNSPPPRDTYPDALKKATLAVTLSESAQSTDDWALVAGRWQQAIDLLKAVPSSSENYNQVAAKISDYQRKRDSAKVKANQSIPTSSPLGRVVVVSEDADDNAAPALAPDGGPNESTDSSEPNSSEPAIAANPSPQTANRPDEAKATEDGLYLAPIIRRSGGTPVIHVEFNNRYTVEMIVDTGASGTVLTQQVAQTLGIEPIGQTNMATASAQNVPFLLGRVSSIEVEGAVLENSVVAIAGPNLETGLLGNDFFKDYDVTVKADVVEFRER